MNRNSLITILNKFDNITILVIGDLILDRFIYGSVSRISPEAPIPLIDINQEISRLGGAANAIKNISLLGGKVIAVGVVGDDWFGKRLIDLVRQECINSEGVLCCDDRPTTVKTRLIAGKQQLIRFDRENRKPVKNEIEEALLDFVQQKIESVDIILISDYNKGVITRSLLDRLTVMNKKHNKPIVIYPKIEGSFDYNGATLVLTNQENACSITGIKQINETSIRNMGQWLLTHLECRYVVITCGRQGMYSFNDSGVVNLISPLGDELYNMTGTIDAIAGIIALSLPSSDLNLAETLDLANIGSSIACSKKEDSTVTRDEIINKLKET